ncbi:MAG: hypothetical protein R6V08_00430 [Desulfuromonadales bacterium]
MQPTIFFAHGKESGPWGSTIRALASVAREKGFPVESPDYSETFDPETRIRKLLYLAGRAEGPLVLVGSSMGGYVSTIAADQLHPIGLFLMAPAFYLPGYAHQDPLPVTNPTVIVHGWNDEVVPVDYAILFARRNRAELHLLESDHSLTNHLSVLQVLFGNFLDQL